MSAAVPAGDPLDWSSLQAVMIRWELAEQYLLSAPEVEEVGKMALEVLISHDFPMLLHELGRLRPELSGESEAQAPRQL